MRYINTNSLFLESSPLHYATGWQFRLIGVGQPLSSKNIYAIHNTYKAIVASNSRKAVSYIAVNFGSDPKNICEPRIS